MEPVVAAPTVDHRVHRHRDFQRRVRIHQRHQRLVAVVADADNADAAVAFRHMLHQPIDRVVCVGAVVDLGRIERIADQRAVHHIRALRAVLAADVLDDADVAALGDDVGGIIIPVERGDQMPALHVGGQRVRVIGRAGQQHRRAGRALGDQDHGVELDAVAHRDLGDAPFVVPALRCRRDRRRPFVIGWRRRGNGPSPGQQRRNPAQPCPHVRSPPRIERMGLRLPLRLSSTLEGPLVSPLQRRP